MKISEEEVRHVAELSKLSFLKQKHQNLRQRCLKLSIW